jgi:hypothetical protein
VYSQWFNLPTFIEFIDYEEAFDSLEENNLWEIRYEKGLPEHIIRAVQNVYIDMR